MLNKCNLMAIVTGKWLYEIEGLEKLLMLHCTFFQCYSQELLNYINQVGSVMHI